MVVGIPESQSEASGSPIRLFDDPPILGANCTAVRKKGLTDFPKKQML